MAVIPNVCIKESEVIHGRTYLRVVVQFLVGRLQQMLRLWLKWT